MVLSVRDAGLGHKRFVVQPPAFSLRATIREQDRWAQLNLPQTQYRVLSNLQMERSTNCVLTPFARLRWMLCRRLIPATRERRWRWRRWSIISLAERYADKEIAVRLNAEGLTSSTGKSFTASMISWIRFKHRIPGPSRLPGTLTVNEVRARYGVSMHVVYYWIARGIVPATQRETNTPYSIAINDNVDRRLRKWVANSGHLHPSSQTPTA